ncbi:uncharacterized protein CTRU02_206250 [Colletotrichum truncatum]|uniref:Uncharacterized protein n=1 Tax=Colletotrichum truncatum TaxID=5467 RepID=A0ACC3Z6E4_COLTU|nr:uncharacterized protein CTRU02_09912 [Colletotrichum truncatum]KAF6788099.1 hypothetical protein CTRU02_09912 [Colletotrichum truncatum]
MQPQILLVAAASAVFAAPAPAPEPAIGATVPAYRLICSGVQRGNKLSFDNIMWAIKNRRNELDLQAGYWNPKNVVCTDTDRDKQHANAVVITYNHQRNVNAQTTLRGGEGVVCAPASWWERTSCPE